MVLILSITIPCSARNSYFSLVSGASCAIRTIASSTHTIPTQYDHSVLHPIPVDKQGMQTNLLPADKRPRFVFVTPSHQFPLGGLLPIQRRIQLIQFVRMSECFIVEDDYDSEFRYSGTPVSSLQELEPERVIYVGTVSKI